MDTRTGTLPNGTGQPRHRPWITLCAVGLLTVPNALALLPVHAQPQLLRAQHSSTDFYEVVGAMTTRVVAGGPLLGPQVYIYQGGRRTNSASHNYAPNGVDPVLHYDRELFVVRHNEAGKRRWSAHYAVEEVLARFVGLTTDADGNVVLVGVGFNDSGRPEGLYLVKYSTDGALLWQRRYNAEMTGLSVTSDAYDNLYVAGYLGINIEKGLLFKFDSDGNWAWEAGWPVNPDGASLFRNIVVDPEGFVYVAGRSGDSGLMAWKYASTGDLSTAYSGGKGSAGYAVALGPGGTVYVLGSKDGDFLTVKFESDSREAWSRQYDRGFEMTDAPRGLRVDADGNAYVVGMSETPTDRQSDGIIIKYTPDGSQAWIDRFDAPDDILIGVPEDVNLALGSDGDVFVAGTHLSATGEQDLVTTRYDSNGMRRWTNYRRFPHKEVRWVNHMTRIRTRSAGIPSTRLYVSGGVFDSLPAPSESERFDNPLVTFDENGNHLGTSTYFGQGNYRPNDAVTDARNITVVGRGGDPQIDVYIRRDLTISNPPHRGWIATYDGPVKGEDEATGVAIDADRNVYVTGFSEGAGTGLDFVTLKFDEDGRRQWVARHDGPASRDDIPVDVALDGEDAVIVTGHSEGQGTGPDIRTLKYDAQGQPVWTAVYDGPDANEDTPVGLLVDGDGSLYIYGSSIGLGTDVDYVTIKYSAAGEERWVRRYDGDSSASDSLKDAAFDFAGNLIVTGTSASSMDNPDIVTIAYTAEGQALWTARYDDAFNRPNRASGVATDSLGNIYVTGATLNSGVGFDFITVKYDAAGQEQWVRLYDGPDNLDDAAVDIALAHNDEIVVTGWSDTPDGPLVATVGYDADGTRLWALRYGSTLLPGGSRPGMLRFNEDGSFFVVGTSGDPEASEESVWTTLRYGRTGFEATSREGEATPVGAYRLFQNYPNPFNPETTLSYEVPRWSDVTLTVFDLLGRAIRVVASGPKPAGTHTVTFDAKGLPAGVYFYRLEAGDFVKTKPMVVLK